MKPYSSFLSLFRLVATLFAALPSLPFAMVAYPQDPVMRAMRDDLGRSKAQL